METYQNNNQCVNKGKEVGKPMKKRIFDIIQIGEKDDSASRIFDLFIVCVILVHIAVLFITTFDVSAAYMDGLHTIKMVTISR